VGCILIDPPWPIEGSVLPYIDVQVDDLKLLPVGELAAERCHIHLWTLPNSYHRIADDIVEHWGFRVVSEFVWCKTQVGRGHYWRMSHEILLTAVRGQDDRFDDRSLRSCVEASRSRHSEKPDVVREMIERASPGPRLELFARKLCRVGMHGDTRSLSHCSINPQPNCHPVDRLVYWVQRIVSHGLGHVRMGSRVQTVSQGLRVRCFETVVSWILRA
jgi:N6-adenosine-specific RNA methylase IME4